MSSSRRPTRDEFTEPAHRIGKFLAYRCEAQAEMRRHVETIPRCEQDTQLCGGLAKGAAVFSAEQPWKCGHSATRRNPANRFAMVGHEGVKLAKIFSSGFLRFPEHGVAVPHRDFRQHFSGSIV